MVRKAKGFGAILVVSVLVASTVAFSVPIATAAIPPVSPAGSVRATPLPGFGAIAVDNVHGHVFVSSPTTDSVSVLDFDGNIVQTISGESGARALLVDGDRLYVGLSVGIDVFDTATLTRVGAYGTGTSAPIANPRSLFMVAGRLWTVTGTCSQSNSALVSIDPSTGVTSSTALSTLGGLGSCTYLQADPSVPDVLFAFEAGLSPGKACRIEVATAPVATACQEHSAAQSNVQQLAVTSNGRRLIEASGAGYSFSPTYHTSDLTVDDAAPSYSLPPYPTAVTTSSARGGLVAWGINGVYEPDVLVYSTDATPTLLLTHDFGTSSDTTFTRGMAFSADANDLFVVHGQAYGSAPTASLSVFHPPNSTTLTVHGPAVTSYGQPTQLVADLTLLAGGGPDPVGTITFSAGNTVIGTAPLVGRIASLVTSNLAIGTQPITASYSGTPNDRPSNTVGFSIDVVVPPPGRFVRSAWQHLIGDDSGLGPIEYIWSQQIATGTLSKQQLAASLASSAGATTNAVRSLYQQALGRVPDQAGLAYWTGQILTGRATTASVAAQLYGSAEAFTKAGATNSDWVESMYRQLLGRAPDPDGLAYWVAVTGRSRRVAVASAFYASLESRNARVTAMYASLLGRVPDDAGLAYFASALLRHSDSWVAAALVASDEFFAKAQTDPDVLH